MPHVIKGFETINKYCRTHFFLQRFLNFICYAMDLILELMGRDEFCLSIILLSLLRAISQIVLISHHVKARLVYMMLFQYWLFPVQVFSLLAQTVSMIRWNPGTFYIDIIFYLSVLPQDQLIIFLYITNFLLVINFIFFTFLWVRVKDAFLIVGESIHFCLHLFTHLLFSVRIGSMCWIVFFYSFL